MRTIIKLAWIVGVICQNYTVLQKQKLASLGPEIESFYSKLYGDEDSLLLSKSIKLKKWNYPTSSVHELKSLYNEEKDLVRKLTKFLRLLVKKELYSELHSAIKEFEFPSEENFDEAAGLGLIQIQAELKMGFLDHHWHLTIILFSEGSGDIYFFLNLFFLKIPFKFWIQGHYELDINEILSGEVAGYQSPHSLSSSDCHQLSKAARLCYC